MCGIAGILDLTGQRDVPEGVIRRMAHTLIHRGPDEEGFLKRPGLALASIGARPGPIRHMPTLLDTPR
jgi:asparagine synthase (glutamine-hydrolysing)